MAAWSKFCTDDPQTFRQYRKKCRPDDLTPGIVHSCSVYFRSLRSGHHRLHISVCIIIIIIIIIIITIIIIIIITTAAEFSLGGSSPYISRDKTNKNKYIHKQNNKK